MAEREKIVTHPAYQGTEFVAQGYHQLDQAKGLIKKAKEVKGSDPLKRARLAFAHVAQALELLNTIKCGALDEEDDNKVSTLITDIKRIESRVNQEPPQEVLEAIAKLEV